VIGGPLVGGLGATGTLVASGALTVLLAAAARFLWVGEDARGTRRPSEQSPASVRCCSPTSRPARSTP
jgi:hypothetical protein